MTPSVFLLVTLFILSAGSDAQCQALKVLRRHGHIEIEDGASIDNLPLENPRITDGHRKLEFTIDAGTAISNAEIDAINTLGSYIMVVAQGQLSTKLKPITTDSINRLHNKRPVAFGQDGRWTSMFSVSFPDESKVKIVASGSPDETIDRLKKLFLELEQYGAQPKRQTHQPELVASH